MGPGVRVNIRAHILAARRLLPGWLERGEGYFVTTASAAGLLTQIGSAPYAVTKHAAVAFAEWLSVTYGDRGSGSAACARWEYVRRCSAARNSPPRGSQRGRDARARRRCRRRRRRDRRERFLILPHPEVLTFFQRKAMDYDRWLAGMRRLQARTEGWVVSRGLVDHPRYTTVISQWPGLWR